MLGKILLLKFKRDKKKNKTDKDIEKLKDDISLEESEPTGKRYLQVLILFLTAAIIIALGVFFRWDKRIIGVGVFLFGLVSQGWASLISLLGGVPGVGHVIVRFLALPLLFLVNGIGNILAFAAIKMGYKKEIIDTKLLAWTFAGGLLIGFIIGGLI
jgi:hypothetical protein